MKSDEILAKQLSREGYCPPGECKPDPLDDMSIGRCVKIGWPCAECWLDWARKKAREE